MISTPYKNMSMSQADPSAAGPLHGSHTAAVITTDEMSAVCRNAFWASPLLPRDYFDNDEDYEEHVAENWRPECVFGREPGEKITSDALEHACQLTERALPHVTKENGITTRRDIFAAGVLAAIMNLKAAEPRRKLPPMDEERVRTALGQIVVALQSLQEETRKVNDVSSKLILDVSQRIVRIEARLQEEGARVADAPVATVEAPKVVREVGVSTVVQHAEMAVQSDVPSAAAVEVSNPRKSAPRKRAPRRKAERPQVGGESAPTYADKVRAKAPKPKKSAVPGPRVYTEDETRAFKEKLERRGKIFYTVEEREAYKLANPKSAASKPDVSRPSRKRRRRRKPKAGNSQKIPRRARNSASTAST